MEGIHNTKKRMPVILGQEDEDNWLDPGLSREEIEHLMEPYDDGGMVAYPVSPIITDRSSKKNGPEIQKRHSYPELQSRDLFSFT